MLLGTAGVYANEPVANDDDFVVTYSAEVIDNSNELLDFYLNEQRTKSTPSNDDIIITQLIETREYMDGHVEQDFVVSNLLLLDQNGVKATPGSTDKTGGGSYSIAAVHRASFSQYFGSDDWGAANYIKITSVQTRINSNSDRYSLDILQFYNMSDWSSSIGDEEGERTIYSAQTGTWYTLATNARNYYNVNNGAVNVFTTAEVTASNGYSFEMSISYPR